MEWIICNSDAVAHSGVPDMKWGIRRYQNKDGTWTLLGKLRRRQGSSDVQKRADRKNEAKNLKSKAELDTAKTAYRIQKTKNRQKLAKAKGESATMKEALKKKIEEHAENKKAKAAEKEAKERAALIRSGDLKKIMANKEKLSDDDIRELGQRLQLEQNLSRISDAEKARGLETYQRVGAAVRTTADITGNLVNIYNNVAKGINAFMDKDLPTIGGERRQSAYETAMQQARLRLARANATAAERRLQDDSSSSSSSHESGSSSTSSPESSPSSSTSHESSSSSSSENHSSGQTRMTGSQLRRASQTASNGRWTQQAQDTASRRAAVAGRTNQRLRDLRIRAASIHGTDSEEYRRIEQAERASEILAQHHGNQYAEISRRNPTGQTASQAARNTAVTIAHQAAEALRTARLSPVARRAARETAQYRAEQAARDIDRAYDTLQNFDLTDYERRYGLRDDH